MAQFYFVNILYLFVACCLAGDFGWDQPLLPATFPGVDSITFRYNSHSPATASYALNSIPPFVWISYYQVPDDVSSSLHTYFMIQNNPTWKFSLVGKDDQQHFIDSVFNSTSIQWAHNMISESAGVSKSDIWRLCVLYTFGGLYIDDDSTLASTWDDLLSPNDTLVLGFEKHRYHDDCFRSDFHLSKHSMLSMNSDIVEIGTNGRILINWAIFSKPRHPLILNCLRWIVEIIKKEYLGNSVLKKQHFEFGWKIITCTTGPSLLTAAIIEGTITNSTDASYRLAGANWFIFNGTYKTHGKGIGKRNPNYYMNVLSSNFAQNPSYLTSYALRDFENGTLVRLIGGRAVYMISGAMKREFPDFATFIAMNLTADDVKVLERPQFDAIPLGPLLPIILKNGTLIKLSVERSVYMVCDNQKREFPDFTTFVAMNFDVKNIRVLGKTDFDSLPIGPPLPALSMSS